MILNFFLKKEKGGFLVLTLVLLVCAVVLAITTGVFLRSTGQTNSSIDSERSLRAWGAVNACGEYALLQMSKSNEAMPGWAYTGEESLPVGAETCYIYTIEDGDNGVKLIKASSTVSNFTKKLLIEVATNTPAMVVNSWKEVADF
jgi:hypothetical protein